MFGQFLQDKLMYRNMHWYTDAEQCTMAAGPPRVVCSTEPNMDTDAYPSFLGAIETAKPSAAVVDTPRLVGSAFLDISNVMLLKVHYNYYKHVYGSRCRLLFTDTDPLTYQNEREHIIADMVRADAQHIQFDLRGELESITNQNKQRLRQVFQVCKQNHGILGTLQCECGSAHILEFVGLAAQLYSMELVAPDGSGAL